MGRPAEAIAARERCTRGWRGQSCKKRTCADLRRGVGAGLAAGAVRGAAGSGRAGRAVGGDSSGRGGAAVGRVALRASRAASAQRSAWAVGSRARRSRSGRGYLEAVEADHNGARNACKREMGRCLPLAMSAWEPQKRGPGHVHPVFHVYSPADVEVARCYLGHVARLGTRHGFGFVGEKHGKSMQLMSGDRAAAYLSSYFVTGKGRRRRCRRTRGTRICRGC